MSEFVPLVASTVLVWGEYQRALFLSEGVHGSEIHAVGCQRMNRTSSSRAGPPKVKALDSNGSRIRAILIGSTVLRTTDKDHWIGAVERLVRSLPGIKFIIRLHPSDRLPEYLIHFRGLPGLEVQEAGQVSLEDAFALSDVVVVDSSTVGFDALFHGKLVAILDPYPTPKIQDVMLDALEHGAAIYSREPETLARELERLSMNEDEMADVLRQAMVFTDNYLCAFGEDAVGRIIDVLDQVRPPNA